MTAAGGGPSPSAAATHTHTHTRADSAPLHSDTKQQWSSFPTDLQSTERRDEDFSSNQNETDLKSAHKQDV